MRTYSLVVGGKVLCNLSKDNANAPRITFDLRQYDGAEVESKAITLYNMPREFYQNQKNLLGKQVELYAGFFQSPILTKMGIIPIKNNLICFGYIINTIGAYHLGEFNIILGSSPIAYDKQGAGVKLEVKNGDSVKSKIKEVLGKLYTKSNIEISGIEVQALDNEDRVCYSSYDLRDFATKYNARIFTTSDGFLISDAEISGAGTPIPLKSGEFIGNVTYKGYTTIQASVMMRADIKVGSIIDIPSTIFATVTPQANFTVNAPKAFIMGKFVVIKVWHKGDSTSEDPNAWTTNFEAVPL